MGSAMVKRLLAAGHPVTGYNRTRAKAEALASQGLRVADSAARRGRRRRRGAQHGDGLGGAARRGAPPRRHPGRARQGRGVGRDEHGQPRGDAHARRARGGARAATLLDAPVSGSTVTIAQGQLALHRGRRRRRPRARAALSPRDRPDHHPRGRARPGRDHEDRHQPRHRRPDAGLQRVGAARREVRHPARARRRGAPQERDAPRPC